MPDGQVVKNVNFDPCIGLSSSFSLQDYHKLENIDCILLLYFYFKSCTYVLCYYFIFEFLFLFKIGSSTISSLLQQQSTALPCLMFLRVHQNRIF